MKKLISVVLAVILALSCMPFAVAQDNPVRLYNVYGDGMLFQQNKEAVFAGEGKSGSVVEVTLSDDSGILVQAESLVKADGTFSVSFTAPSGAFREYTVTLSQDGTVFETLDRVVFGELWLASGQSNMQYPLAQAKYGYDSYVNGERFSEWLRVFMVPPYVNSYTEIGFVPDEPQKDIDGAVWVDGQNEFIYNMSAVAFYFAEEMLTELQMPVGIINAALGGSSIASWISREKIDSEAEYKNMLYGYGAYKESKDWKAENQNVYADLGANYNHKISALENFRPVGMIWYQGESDMAYSEEYYSKAIDVLQDLYTEVFDSDYEKFPLIYTNLAEYFYTEDGMVLPDRNIAFSKIQENRPGTRATFGIYDISLEYVPEIGLIHPASKKEIGERMALCAKGMIYGKFDSYTSATVKETAVKDGSVYVTFRNVGDGLVVKGDKLYGFAVCGAEGIYIEAEAEIVSKDTVRVWNSSIADPVAVTYAYCMGNGRANLACAYEGEDPLPVSIFATDRTVSEHYWTDKQWAGCEIEGIWHTMTDTNSGYYPSWTSETATLSRSDASPYAGSYCMKILSDKEKFSVNPVLTHGEGPKAEAFWDTDTDYSDYDTMSFTVRNNGTSDVYLDAVKFYKTNLMWHAAAVDGTTDTAAVIPADGEWHTVTLDLNRMYLHGNEGGIAFTNEKLAEVRDIEFCFSADKNTSSDLSFDNVTFTASDENVRPQFDADFASADSIFEFFCVAFTRFIGLFAKIFA